MAPFQVESTKKQLPSIAAYRRIEEDLRARAAAGEWQPGAMLPSRKNLAREYGVDLSTIQRAIASLLSDKTLRADSRRGTFVGNISAISQRPVVAGDPVKDVGHAGLRQASKKATATIGLISQLYDDTYGVVTPNVGGSLVVHAFEHAVAARGASTLYLDRCASDFPMRPVAEMIAELMSRGVDAVVLNVEMTAEEVSDIASLLDTAKTPILLVGGTRYRCPVLGVYYSSTDAGYHAAEHLLERGCEKLLFFSPFTAIWVEERLAGAREAMRTHRIPQSRLVVRIGEKDTESVDFGPNSHSKWRQAAYSAARDLLASGLLEDGVIGGNDCCALGFMQASKECGRLPGSDYAIIGFDGMPEACTSGLSTLRPPYESMGREAALLILRALTERRTDLRVTLHSDLIVRDSTINYAPMALV